MAQYELPYTSFDQASKDNFKAIGGPAEAFKYLKRGYYDVNYRDARGARDRAFNKAVRSASKANPAVFNEDGTINFDELAKTRKRVS